MAETLHTPVGMLSFPHLFVPKPRSPGGEPVFSLSLVFDQAAQNTQAYRNLKTAVAEAIDEEWGQGKSRDAAFVRKLRLPFRDAAAKEYAGYGPGKIFISPWTKTKPGIVDAETIDILVASDVWAGQLARCSVAPFAYNQSGNVGVNFMLSNVQIVKADMPRMDGRKAANQDFGRITDQDGGVGAKQEEEALF